MANFTYMLDRSFSPRSLLYLVAPSECMYEEVKQVPSYVDKVVPMFITTIILEAIVATFINRSALLRINDAIVSLSAGITSRLPGLLMISLELQSYIWFYENYNLIKLPWNSTWTWMLCLFGVDLGYYWVHRLSHEVNLFWVAHQVHHSSEDYNLTTALRQSALQQYISFMFYLPLALLVPPSIFSVHIQLNLIFQFWIHTELVTNIGPLEYILNTPSHHRVHHARNPQYINKNYAGVLIIWDRMFGTFEPEQEEGVYGLTTPIATFNQLWIQFGPLLQALKAAIDIEGVSNKFRKLFYGPGWTTGRPRKGSVSSLPKLNRETTIKYDIKSSIWCRFYCFLHFVLVLITNDTAIRHKADMTTIEGIAAILAIFCSISCLGLLLDNRYYASFLEYLRCVLYLMIDNMDLSTHSKLIPDPMRNGFRVLFLLSSCFWITRAIRISIKSKAA